MTESKQPRQIIEEVNEVARMILADLGGGYVAAKGYKFYATENPRARRAWHRAVEIYEFLTASEVHDALLEMDEDTESSDWFAQAHALAAQTEA